MPKRRNRSNRQSTPETDDRQPQNSARPGAKLIWPAIVGLILVLALWLRADTLGDRPLWFDEQFTEAVLREASGWAQVASVGTIDKFQHPPLHYLLAYGATRTTLGAVTLGAVQMRLPSLLAGVGAVAVILWLGTLLFERRVAAVAGLLMATSIYHINYSQDARPYALFVLLVSVQYLALFTYLLSNHRRRSNKAPLIIFVIAGTASLYTLHLALMQQAALLALWLLHTWFFLRRTKPAKGQWRQLWLPPLLCYAAMGLLYLPQLKNFLGFLSTDWMSASFQLAISLEVLTSVAARWGAGPGWASLLFGALCLSGIWRTSLRHRQAWGVILWLTVPFAAFAVTSFSRFFDVRYVMSALPAFLLLVAVALVAAADGVARTVRAVLPAAASRRSQLICLGLLMLPILGTQALAYQRFRALELRCSDFFRQPHILDLEDGFCRDHILLNSLIPEHRFLLRDTAPSDAPQD